ncbi:MAG: hypothetical protein IH958_04185 [Chloroflexi bacterium]|nr:hypothetical protein [Chloroflexota bacterium]
MGTTVGVGVGSALGPVQAASNASEQPSAIPRMRSPLAGRGARVAGRIG